jgi:hypothetical protein
LRLANTDHWRLRRPRGRRLGGQGTLTAESIIQEIKDFLDQPIINLRFVHNCLHQERASPNAARNRSECVGHNSWCPCVVSPGAIEFAGGEAPRRYKSRASGAALRLLPTRASRVRILIQPTEIRRHRAEWLPGHPLRRSDWEIRSIVTTFSSRPGAAHAGETRLLDASSPTSISCFDVQGEH